MQGVDNLKMSRQIVIFLLILAFLSLIGDFQKLKGFDYPLFKILVKLIGVILFLIVVLDKKEILDENQRKIEEYFTKLKKKI